MNWLDIIICIVLLIGLYKGYLNGFFVELTSLIALIAAIYGSIYFSNYAGDWLREKVEWDDMYITIASFIVTFLVIIFVITYVGKLITKVVKTVNLSFINKIAGAAFGLVKMGFLASVILMFINTASGEFHMIGKDVKEDSIVYEHVEPLAPFLLPKILEEADRVDRKLRGDDLEKLDQEDREKPKDSSAWNIF
jgi:membrane protein required for colicin V production